MKLPTWLKLLHYRLWTGRRKRKRLRLVPRDKTTTTPVNWNAQYHYKPDNKENSHADS